MQYVFETQGCKRYTFPTHANELVIDRAAAAVSEVFVVVLEPGQATHVHKHDDTEQIFYIVAGEGTLWIGPEQAPHALRVGQVVRIPPSTLHSIGTQGPGELRYIAVDCFVVKGANDELTWDDHVRTMCREQGWAYDRVVGGAADRVG